MVVPYNNIGIVDFLTMSNSPDVELSINTSH